MIDSASKDRQRGIKRTAWLLGAVAIGFFVAIMIVEYIRPG